MIDSHTTRINKVSLYSRFDSKDFFVVMRYCVMRILTPNPLPCCWCAFVLLNGNIHTYIYKYNTWADQLSLRDPPQCFWAVFNWKPELYKSIWFDWCLSIFINSQPINLNQVSTYWLKKMITCNLIQIDWPTITMTSTTVSESTFWKAVHVHGFG